MKFLQMFSDHPFGATLTTFLFGALVYVLRQLPVIAWTQLRRRFTVTLSVRNDGDAFKGLLKWISTQIPRHAIREGAPAQYVLPYGQYHVRYCNRRVLAVYKADGPEVTNYNNRVIRPAIIQLTMIGFDLKLLETLIDSVVEQPKNNLTIYAYSVKNTSWGFNSSKVKRPLESVVLSKISTKTGNSQSASVSALSSAAEKFFEAEDWYVDNGVPYRAGWLFEGPPGTGKTSTAVALAGAYDRPVFYLDLASMSNDETLAGAISGVPKNAVLLIEDIDRLGVATIGGTSSSAITLSGLLNSFDGVIASDGRLLIMTTNHSDRLDPALVRSGRIDKRWHFPNLTQELALEMAQRFYPDESQVFLSRCIATYKGPDLGAAVWQEVFLECRDEPSRIIEKLEELSVKPSAKTNGVTLHSPSNGVS